MSQVIPGEALSHQSAPNLPIIPEDRIKHLNGIVDNTFRALNEKAPHRSFLGFQVDDESYPLEQFRMIGSRVPEMGVVQMSVVEPKEDVYDAVFMDFHRDMASTAYVIANVFAKEVLTRRAKYQLHGIESEEYAVLAAFDMSFIYVPGNGSAEGISNGNELAKLVYLYMEDIDKQLRGSGARVISEDAPSLVSDVRFISLSSTRRDSSAIAAMDKASDIEAPGFSFDANYDKVGIVSNLAREFSNPAKR